MLWLNIIIFKRFSCLVRVRLIDVLQVPQCIIPFSTDMKHGRLQFNYGVSIYVSPVFCFKTDSGRKSSVSKSFWVKFKFSVYFSVWLNRCCDSFYFYFLWIVAVIQTEIFLFAGLIKTAIDLVNQKPHRVHTRAWSRCLAPWIHLIFESVRQLSTGSSGRLRWDSKSALWSANTGLLLGA